MYVLKYVLISKTPVKKNFPVNTLLRIVLFLFFIRFLLKYLSYFVIESGICYIFMYDILWNYEYKVYYTKRF